MSHSYQQSSYLAAPYSFEAVKNPETEQLRPLAGVRSFYHFSGKAMEANETLTWTMPGDVLVRSLWVSFPGAPGGTMLTLTFDELGNPQGGLSVNVNDGGEKFNNVWAFEYKAALLIPKGWTVQFSPSVAIIGVASYSEPALFLGNQVGVRIA